MTIEFTDLIKIDELSADRFMAHPSGGPGFLFGGLTMAMAVAGAVPTVDDGMVPLSLRCSFISFGAWGPTQIEVERVNTSRSFAGRRLRLTQDDKLIAAVDITFHRPQVGPERAGRPNAGDLRPGQALRGEAEFGAQQPIDPVEMRFPGGAPTPGSGSTPFGPGHGGRSPEGTWRACCRVGHFCRTTWS